jgi:hypothetical protein
MLARENRLQQVQRVQKYGAHGALGAIGQFVVIQSLREGDRQTGRMIREDLEPLASDTITVYTCITERRGRRQNSSIA